MTCLKGRQWSDHSRSHDLLEVAPRVDSILLSSPPSHMQRITFHMGQKNKSSVYFCQLLNSIVTPVSFKPKTFYFYGFIWKRLRILPQWPREWTAHCGEYFDPGNTTNWLGLIKDYPIGRALTEVPLWFDVYLQPICNLNKSSTRRIRLLCPETPVLSVLFSRFSKIQWWC